MIKPPSYVNFYVRPGNPRPFGMHMRSEPGSKWEMDEVHKGSWGETGTRCVYRVKIIWKDTNRRTKR